MRDGLMGRRSYNWVSIKFLNCIYKENKGPQFYYLAKVYIRNYEYDEKVTFISWLLEPKFKMFKVLFPDAHSPI